MALENSNQNYTGLIQKYIGTAYDKVSSVADNILSVIFVSENIETLETIAGMEDEILQVIDSVEEFNGIYYGALDTEPLLDPNGDPSDPGDLYYNTVDQQLYIYTSQGTWEGVGNVIHTVEHFVVEATPPASYTISLVNAYTPGHNNISIYVNGEYTLSKVVDVTGKYNETSNYIITFPDAFLVEGDTVDCIVSTESSTVMHMTDVDLYRYVTVGTNEQIINIPDGATYEPGTNNLEVYDDRRLQLVDFDYTETDPNTITFLSPLAQGTEVLFKIGKIISNTAGVPKVLMQDEKPDETLYVDGQEWFRTSTGRHYILYKDGDTDQWVSLNGEDTIIIDGGDPIEPPIPDPIQVRETIIQTDQPNPEAYSEGALWFNTHTGELFFLYVDPDNTAQWLKVST